MRRRRVGRSGLSVSRLGLGTAMWGEPLDEGICRDLLVAYVDAGGTLLDTAHSYGLGRSEEIVGALLDVVVSRDELTICTKAGVARTPDRRVVDTSRSALLRHLDASLGRLGIDHVDLWLAHTWSDTAPLEETVSALEYAVSSGRARYVGVSNYSGWQTARAFSLLESARVPLVANEVEYSLVVRGSEEELLTAAAALGFGLLAYSPLARGVLTGKYRFGVSSGARTPARQVPTYVRDRLDARSTAVVEALATAAGGLDVTATEVALAWVRDRPGVTAPIVGCRSVVELQTALASENLELPPEIIAALDEISD
ncbi:MAG TPA: aldo/keto reductase [Lapillicoccus sp.]|nr:aldo/keto reductase [Lapillicoccus sp.]